MDIDYLKRIGQVDSIPVSVDSAKRDKHVFPSPAEYDVVFEEPFRNVVGLDVLDATIPNSTYNVDEKNCTLSFAVRMFSSFEKANPDDYPFLTGRRTIGEYLSELSSSSEFISVWKGKSYTTFRLKIVGSLFAASTVAAQRVQYPVDGPVNTTPGVLVDKDILAIPMEPGDALRLGIEPLRIDPETSYLIDYDLATDKYYVQDNDAKNARAVELPTFELSPGDRRVLVSATQTLSPGASATRYGHVSAASLDDAPIAYGSRMTFPKFAEGRLAGLATFGLFRVAASFYDSPLVSYHHELHLHNCVVDLGNHTVESFIEAVKSAIPRFTVPVRAPDAGNAAPPAIISSVINLTSTSTVNPGNYSRQGKIRFWSVFPFWFDMEKSTISNVIGFSTPAVAGQPGYAPLRVGDNRWVFGARLKDNAYSVVTPGVISLLAERIVILRCPQIEEHAYSSYSCGSNSGGIGVFKLYDAQYAHLRFDFTKLIKLDFHPIGKLQKIRIRFECADGSLYDFKGVDHHIFVSIKFLAARTDRERPLPPPESLLNPDYDPDVMRYLANARGSAHDEDSDSDDAILNDEEHARRFQQARLRFIQREAGNRRAVRKGAAGSVSVSESVSETGSETGSAATGSDSGSESG